MNKLIAIIIGLWSSVAMAQLDSINYGTETTKIIANKSLEFLGNDVINIDTTLDNLHQYELTKPFNIESNVDLGNYGTALRSTFENLESIGTRLGIESYSPYKTDLDNIKYYDTKSPYSKVEYVQGGGGQQFFDFVFSRNINKNWNASIDYQRLTSNYQLGFDTEETHTNSYHFVFNTHYQTPNQRYKVYANFIHFKHLVNETGGGLVDTTQSVEDIFDFRNAIVQLSDARNEDTRHQFLVHQFYNLIHQKVYLFHELNKEIRFYEYQDDDVETNINFYSNFTGLDSVASGIGLKSDEWDNKVGLLFKDSLIKGKAYYRNQWVRINDKDTSLYDVNQLNHFLGGSVKIGTTKINLYAKGEVSQQGEFFVDGQLKLWNGGYRLDVRNYQPSFVKQNIHSEFKTWKNDFPFTFSMKHEFFQDFALNKIHVVPFVKFGTYTNYIVFNEDAQPIVNTNTFSWTRAGVQWKVPFGKFQYNGHLQYFTSASSDLRAPKWNTYHQFYLKSRLFKSLIQLGIESNWSQGYQFYGYDPITSQFYTQNNFKGYSYGTLDAFFNIQLKKAFVFLKMSHLNQGLMAEDGFFTVPYYPGTARTFVFGVKWLFFD